MRIFPAILFLFFTSGLWAQIGMGQWRMHVPARKAIDVAAGNGKVYAALTSGVIEYDIAASENRVLNNTNFLSDINVKCITYEPSTKSFFVGYQNGNLDQITSGESVINIPGITSANVSGTKEINRMISANNMVYVLTGFGIVLIDPAKNEVKDTWYPSTDVLVYKDLVFRGDSIYVISETGLYRARATNQFLSNPSQWIKDPRLPEPVNGKYHSLGTFDNEVYFSFLNDAYGGDSIMKLEPYGFSRFLGAPDLGFEIEMTHFEIKEGLFYMYLNDVLIAFDPSKTVNFTVSNYGPTTANPSRVTKYNGTIWVADKSSGLVRFTNPVSYTKISTEGPPDDRYFSLAGEKGKILVTSGTLDRVIRSFNLTGAYTFSNESWKHYERATQPGWTLDLFDIGAGAINPNDTTKIALGTYSKKPLILIDGDQTTQIYTPFNSALDSTTIINSSNGYTCISDLQYDKDGNLWIINCYTGTPLKCLLSNGTWKEYSTPLATRNIFTTKMAIDNNGNKWFGTFGGLVGYNDGGTPENISDDKQVLLNENENTGSLPSRNVTAVAVDMDNEIWIGTESGFAVLYNAESSFTSSNVNASRILIDFEGNIENFLGSTAISDIEIDGGNRKWIATESSGLFLLSPSGQELIANYTMENSPLISNRVMDIEFNDLTGELFIVTDKGLVSFRTDASQEDPNYTSTTVFPNPVRPDYFGPITIQGIRFDSDVKITDMGGNLVYKTTSNGGTATWNGKQLDGSEVASGVYLIWTASNLENAKKVGKVVVIR